MPKDAPVDFMFCRSTADCGISTHNESPDLEAQPIFTCNTNHSTGLVS